MKRNLLYLLAAVVLFLLPNVTFGQAPSLGTTSSFALFTASGAFNSGGATVVKGNIGSYTVTPTINSPGSVIGTIYSAGDAALNQPHTDVSTAFSNFSTGGSVLGTPLQTPGELSPGVYSTGAAAALNGDLTLNGGGNPNALFIININGALTVGGGSNVKLINSASPNNVYWLINGAFELGAGSVFRGTVIAHDAINLLNGSTLFGRGLSTAGAISLQNNVVTIPSHFRSKVSGDWNAIGTWESSLDSTNWVNAAEFPTSDAISINISNGHIVTITNNATASILTINPGARLTLNSAQTLSANIFNINSDAANGTGSYVDNGTTNATIAHVQQYLTGKTGTSTRANWYLSSPVASATATVFNVAAAVNKMTSYDETAHAYVTQFSLNSTALTPGVGYVTYIGGADATYTFTGGNLNTGTVTVNPAPTRTGTLDAKRGFNLVGNPYPSFLDWKDVNNTKTNLRPTIWYRTLSNGSVDGTMTFDTYDGTTGTGNGSNGVVSQYIPPMQAFWVKVDLDGQTAALAFTNTARSHQDQISGTNRLRAPKLVDNTLLRLKVSNGINNDEAIILTDPNAQDTFDYYDSQKMTNDNVNIPEIFTLAGSEELVINHMNNLTGNKELTLGFRPGKGGEFTIQASEISNFSSDTKVILLDKLLNVEQELTIGSP